MSFSGSAWGPQSQLSEAPSLIHETNLNILSTQTPKAKGPRIAWTYSKIVANQNDDCAFLSPTAIVMFTVAILQYVTPLLRCFFEKLLTHNIDCLLPTNNSNCFARLQR